MKVFTVGMDEKPPAKEPLPSPDGVSMTSTPVITFEKKRSSYKSYLMCLLTLFFILLFAIIISELAYNRARDESYLRLRWAEMKHRMGFGCDECGMMHARVAQNFYPQRMPGPPMIIGTYNSKEDEPAAPAALNQDQTTAVTTTTEKSTSKIPLPSGDSRLDFLRKIIPKIKEEAEKAGIDGVMQVKVMQIDPAVQGPPFMDGFGEMQPNMENEINGMRPLFGPLSDILRWTLNEADNSGPMMPPVFNQQNEMLVQDPVPLPPAPVPLPMFWGPEVNNWIAPEQMQPWAQSYQWPRQSPWQWPVNYQRAQQQQQQQQPVQMPNNPPFPPPPPPPPVYQPVAQPLQESEWQNSQWQNGVENANNWQMDAQNAQRRLNWNQPAGNRWNQEVNVKPWQWWSPRIYSSQVPENNQWQQQQQQQQQQANNDLALQRVNDSRNPQNVLVQNMKKLLGMFIANRLARVLNDSLPSKVNIADNLDGRMSQAVLPNVDGNSQWMKYYSQWYASNQQLQQQQPIATAAVSQSLEITGPQTQAQGQPQMQVSEPFVYPDQQQQQQQQQQQIQVAEQRQQEQEQQQQQQPEQQQQQQPVFQQNIVPVQPIVPEVNTAQPLIPEPKEQQSPIVPVEQSVNNMPQQPGPSFIFDNDAWQRPEASVFDQKVAAQQQQQTSLDNEQPEKVQLPQIIDDGALKDSSMETAFQQAPMNDAKLAIGSPVFFQVDEPPHPANL